MLAHLAQDGANVQVDVRWVQHLQTVVYALLAVVQIIIFDLQCLFQVAEG